MTDVKRPLKSIRLKCLDCCGGLSNEVKKCTCKDCPLYPYRFGRRPATVAKHQAARSAAANP